MNNILNDVILYLNENGSTKSIKINGAKLLSSSDGYYSMLVSTHYNKVKDFASICTINPPISRVSIEGSNYKFFNIRKFKGSDILYEIIYTDTK